MTARIGHTTFTTSLFPKNERYLLSVKVIVSKAERLEPGSWVTVRLDLDV